VYPLNDRLGVEEKAVELAIHAAYNPRYSHFYNIGKTKFARLVAANSPSHAMYQIALEKFDGVPFGDNQSGRISPSGVDYPAVFLDADGKPNGVMKVMVAGVMKVLRWINANKDNDDQFHHADILSTARVENMCTTQFSFLSLTKRSNCPSTIRISRALPQQLSHCQ
jgi:hypothetical protein